MKPRLLLIPLVLFAIMSFSPATSDATILIKKDLAQLTAESESVIVARVGDYHCDYAKGTKLIFTYTNMTIEQSFKGKLSGKMVVAEIGGKLGDTTLRVASMPRFHEGERVLLFLKKDALGQQRVYGAIQGKFKVVHNRATDQELVMFSKGLRHVTNPFFATRNDRSPTHVSLEEFKTKVAELTAKAAKKAAKKGEKK